MTVTSKTLADSRDAEEVFATTLPQISFENPYLLHSILALTALHLYQLEYDSPAKKSEYWQQAEQHHDAALNIFQNMVRDIDATNFRAVLAFANTLFPYSCVASTALSGDLDSSFAGILSNMVLTRRIRPMVARFYTEMKESELGRMVPDGTCISSYF